MNISIFRAVLIGVLIGLLTIVAFRFVLIFLILGAIFRLAGKGRGRHEHWRQRKLAYVENVRNMNDEDFQQFKNNFGQGHGCHHRSHS